MLDAAVARTELDTMFVPNHRMVTPSFNKILDVEYVDALDCFLKGAGPSVTEAEERRSRQPSLFCLQ